MANRITADEWVPGVWSHEALMAMQARLDPVRIIHRADDWLRTLDAASAVLEELARRLAELLDELWSGHGADAAQQAVLDYVGASLDGLRRARSVAEGLASLAGAAGDLRAGLIPPEPDEPQQAAKRRLDEALGQVRRLYSGPAVAAGSGVAEIPAPPVPVPTAGVAVPTLPAGGPIPSITPTTAPLTASFAASPGYDEPDLAPDRVDDVRPAAAFTADGHATPALPAADRAAAMPGSPAPSSGASASATPAATAGPTAVSPRPAVPAMPYVGAAYPSYAGRDNAAEHRTPGYLISLDNARELIGPLPKVAPPVLGE